MSRSILIVDDEVDVAEHLAGLLLREGYEVATANSAGEGKRKMAALCPDLVVLDLRLGEDDGAALMSELRQQYETTQFIIITAYGSIRSAVECTRHGAFDYLTKPFEPEELLISVRNAVSRESLRDEVRQLREASSDGGGDRISPLSSRSPVMREVAEYALKAARQDGAVLLLGESGSGKDYMARWIHDRSSRSEGPFFVVNCAAVTRDLAESELFGHEPGSFTGSRGRKRGMIELAAGGTLLLNEVGELDMALQAKLLSFLDSKCFLRVGGERTVRVDVRILAATNRDLDQEMAAGRFRHDLFYRLAVLPLRVPPLRERREDIRQLAETMLEAVGRNTGTHLAPRLTEEAFRFLEEYHWPGNIRELRNVLERALILAPGPEIGPESLVLEVRGSLSGIGSPAAGSSPTQRGPRLPPCDGWNLHENTKTAAREIVLQALQRCGSKREAAELLGLSRHALAHQIRALELDV